MQADTRRWGAGQVARRVLPRAVLRAVRPVRQRLELVVGRPRAYRRLERAVPAQPATFSDKVLHRMAFDRRPLLATLADKVAVRAFVEDRVGPGHLPALYGVFSSARDISWPDLPRQVVLKASHGSGAVAVVWDGAPRGARPREDEEPTWAWRSLIHPDDLDRAQLARLASGWLRLSYEIPFRGRFPEWAYSQIPPRIIAEELLLGEDGRPADDYKLFMMDGRCVAIQMVLDRFNSYNIVLMDPEWHVALGTRRGYLPPDTLPAPPTNLELMLTVASRLSEGLDFVRVDLYDCGTRVVVGELTMYPMGGVPGYEPADLDLTLGSAWTLPPRQG